MKLRAVPPSRSPMSHDGTSFVSASIAVHVHVASALHSLFHDLPKFRSFELADALVAI
jgi:hypothetical protein